jgi:hypothetical protein
MNSGVTLDVFFLFLFDVGAICNTGDNIKDDATGGAGSQFMVDNSEGKRHIGRT